MPNPNEQSAAIEHPPSIDARSVYPDKATTRVLFEERVEDGRIVLTEVSDDNYCDVRAFRHSRL